jgi:hypothetical protein
MERRYTVSEIDMMRERIRSRVTDELMRCRTSVSVNEILEEAETRLRSYMLGGVDPAELQSHSSSSSKSELGNS